jgi:hypothetical protein
VAKMYTPLGMDEFGMVTLFRAHGDSFEKIAKEGGWHHADNPTRLATGAELKAWYEGHPKYKTTPKKRKKKARTSKAARSLVK